MKDNKQSVALGSMRIPFLVLPPTCVALGIAAAIHAGSSINILHLVLVFIGAVCAHISVNALNEYDDFKTGLDFKTIQTPFSGGSKAIPENPEKAHHALIMGLATLAVTIIIGAYFLYVRGLMLLPIGLFGILIVVAYTKWITRSPILCLIAPGLGFGHLMVMGTSFVLTGTYSWTSFLISMVPFFLVSNLLLLNQFPDIDADREIGRKHLPIAVGKNTCVMIYGLFLLFTYISIVLGWVLGLLPIQSLISLICAVLAIHTFLGVRKNADSIEDLIPFMGKNVVLILATHIMLAIGIVWGTF
ncbi:MAG: prenyltransferase [Desulfobacteraceae bacterium]|nr:prenyltransferase [Desulfobacteraceae bacterium]